MRAYRETMYGADKNDLLIRLPPKRSVNLVWEQGRPDPFKSQYWVELYYVWRGANLPMITIEKTNTGHSDYDRLVGRIRLG
jgi:hypothetical protein